MRDPIYKSKSPCPARGVGALDRIVPDSLPALQMTALFHAAQEGHEPLLDGTGRVVRSDVPVIWVDGGVTKLVPCFCKWCMCLVLFEDIS